MNATEMARRSDALYTDTNNMHRRQLCDMIVHREADIEELKEEVYGLHCDIGRLEVENAKLLELVRLMRHHDRVPSVSELEAWHDEGDEIERRMSELGIEVES